MRGFRLMIGLVGAVLAVPSLVCAQASGWSFNRTGDREGWTVPNGMTGAVMGGALWLTPSPREKDPTQLASGNYQNYGEYNPVRRIIAGEKIKLTGPSEHGELSAAGPATRDVISPNRLALAWPSTGEAVARIRVLNLSPATMLLLRWRAVQDPSGTWRSKRCAVQPDLKIWQHLECPFKEGASEAVEAIDQIAIGISENVIRGDLWLDEIAVSSAPRRPQPARPDVASASVVPQVIVPGITQAEFGAAFTALDGMMVLDVPAYGFPYPYMAPSGDQQYGDYPWPQVDSIISAAAAAWSNQAFAEDVLRGVAVHQAQNPDGRISGFPWEPLVGQPGDVGVRPDRFFASAHRIALRSRDGKLRRGAFETMAKYLGWYMSPNKRDSRTGLILGDWEEAVGTEGPNYIPGKGGKFDPQVQRRAPVILNAAVVIGATLTADLGRTIGEAQRAEVFEGLANDLGQAINRYLWDEQDGFYYDFDIVDRTLSKKDPTIYAGGGRNSGAFFTLGYAAPPKREARLLKRLTSSEFNWRKGVLPDAALAEGEHPETWGSNMWALTNVPIIQALEAAHRYDLAAELNWKLVQLIKGSYSEQYTIDGTPVGAKPYGFTAAAMIEGVAGRLFGVDYRGVEETLIIAPRVPRALFNQPLRITNLVLPTGSDTRLSLAMMQTSNQAAVFDVEITGPLPKGLITIELPGTDKRITVPAQAKYRAKF